MKSRSPLMVLALMFAFAAAACQATRSQESHSPEVSAARPPPAQSPNLDIAPKPGGDGLAEEGVPQAANADDDQCGQSVPREELLATARGLVKQGEPGWGYSARLRADVDGDGAEETLWVIAQAEIFRGKPAWDDGQEWQVYVEEDSGEVTHVFARYVQLSQLEVSLTMEEPHEILLNAFSPSTAEIYRLRYEGPGMFSGRRILQEGFIAYPEPVLPGKGASAGP